MKTKHLSGVITALASVLFVFTPNVRAAGLQFLHGHVPAAVGGLRPLGRLADTNRLNLAIALPLRNAAALSNLLQQIYDPASANYHHYLTPEQFTERFGPAEADYKALIAFAGANGLQVTATHPNRVLLDVNAPAADVERALHVTLRVYQHPTEQRTFYAPDTEPSLDLNVPVLHISGLDNYALPRPRLEARPLVAGQAALPNAGSGPSGTFMGQDFRAAYVPDTRLDGTGQTVGLLQFDGYTASDITYYENKAGLPNVPLQNVLIDGATGNPSHMGGEVEVSLDIEMVISMATNLSKVIVYEAPNPSPFVDLLSQMADDNLAKQLSCSWYVPNGTNEPAADVIFQQMAAQGQSFFSASGDSDAYTGLIDFPGDTPYITQVGGTTLTTSGPGGGWVSETVWNWGIELGRDGIGSGGGISTQYPIPSWQTNISMTANQGSTTMRNTPDVALTADNVYVRADGADHNEAGTSCAAPLWAGFAALVNQQAASSGQPAIGCINPALDTIGTGPNYSAVFHDINTGNNTWSRSPGKFYAVAGYDLCTGWGTPAGQNLINALANPEALLITPSTGFTSTGGVGGPFTVTAQNYSLTNSETNTLTWTLANTSAWLNVSSSGGALTPGGPATNVTISLNTAASNLLVGTYSATLWFTNQNDGFGQGRQFKLNVISPPTITQQPTNQAVLEGAVAEFIVQATGGLPLAYQWQFNGTNLTDGGNIAGSTTTNLIISNVPAADVGTYNVVVTNFAGMATSSNALLSITPSAPKITMQPSNEVAVAGTPANFSVAAIGSMPFFYQWSFNATNIDGATNAWLTLTNVQFTNAGSYAVVITNSYGSAVSSNAVLSVVNVPIITAFNPAAGAIGTNVTITGLNFDPNPANNTVYFGAVKAAVISASPTNLVVVVPAGATYAPITVTVNGLTAYASAWFLPTFPGGGALSSSSFASQVTIGAGNNPYRVMIADMDGDGKPDLVVANYYDGTVWVYRNISTNGTLTAASFAAPVILTTGAAGNLFGLAVADLDGDGRLDIVTANWSLNTVSIFQNLSSPGSLTTNSFVARVDLAVAGTPAAVAVGDLDGDGRPEIVVADRSSNTVSILQNLGSGGIITTNSFAAPVNFAVGPTPWRVALADMDGDGKLDVVTANQGDVTRRVSVLQNISTVGRISTNSLAAEVDLPGTDAGDVLAIGDLDGDGQLDLTTGSYSGESVSVYRNLSNPGSITTNSFGPDILFAVGNTVQNVALGDLDGDEKPDVALVTQSASQLSLMRNLSTPGSFTNTSLGPQINFASGNDPVVVAIGDLDGDGRPDIVVANQFDNTLSIYQNQTPFSGPPVIITQPTNQVVPLGGSVSFSVLASGTLPLSYQWYANTNNPILGATNATMTLNDIQDTNAGGYSVIITNIFGSVTSSVASLIIIDPPNITTQPVSLTNGVGTTALFTVAVGGTPPFDYQWLKNGLAMTDGGNVSGSASATLTLTNVSLNDMAGYSVVVTNLAGSVTSSVATLTVLAPPSITVQPLSRTNLVGTTANFTVVATGSLPLSYQWSFNGTNNPIGGATNATLTLASVQTNQAGTYAVLVTNAYGAVWSSNAILTVNPPPTNVPVISTISPRSANIGASVTITGLNFDPNPANNTVYFGAVKAAVISASPTNLVVVVPAGATYAPITVTVNGLTAYASAWFLPTFPGGGALSSSSFASQVTIGAGNNPYRVMIADMDGDGKPDLVVANYYDGTVWVYRNISTNGTLTAASFAAPVILTTGAAGNLFGLAVADLDGDGRLDIVTANWSLNTVSIFQNLSSPGSLTTNSFVARVDLAVAGTPAAVAVGDLDGDGRPEIVVADRSSNTVSILQNLGSGGIITTNSFAAPVNFAVGPTPWRVALADMDGDGKLDVVTANQGDVTRRVSVLQNISTVGRISTNSLAAEVDLPGTDAGDVLAIGDLDGDGQLDLTTGSYSGESVSVYRNLSNPGSITTNSFGPDILFAVGNTVQNVALGDLDGDEKPDVALVTQSASQLSLMRNLSTPGSFTNTSLGPQINFASGNDPVVVAIGDLDGDGRPDIVVANQFDNTLSLYHNISPAGPFIISQPTNQTVTVGGTAMFAVGASGSLPLNFQWSFNGTNNPIGGATNATLILTGVQTNQAGAYAVLVTNLYGSTTSSNATLTVNGPPLITTQPVSLTNYVGTTASFTVTAAGTAPLKYQWNFNSTNLPAATNASLTLTNVLFSQAGNYAVLVTNQFGSVMSSNAALVVIPYLHFVWDPIPSPRFDNTPFAVAVQAQNPTNGLATLFTGTVAFLTTNGLPVNPTVSGNFTQGVWTGTVAIVQTGTNMVLEACDSYGETGLANPINVVAPPSLALARSGGFLLIFWPVDPTGFILETSTNLALPAWTPVDTPPLLIGNQYLESVQISNTNQFYRLRFTLP